MKIFDCTGVSTLNPCVVQVSTVYLCPTTKTKYELYMKLQKFPLYLFLVRLFTSTGHFLISESVVD